MSIRSMLLAVALAVAPIGVAVAQDAVSLPDVANSKYQIEGVINAPSVNVRSGPGEDYYPTQQLAKGANVTVVGIKFEWLKILPPEGSYSYVGAAFVDANGENTSGKINRDKVNVRAGSLLDAMKTTVQTQLNTGDAVQIIGKEDEYLKIKPPAGAYLYINKQFVTIARPAGGAVNPAAPGAITTQTPATPVKSAAALIDAPALMASATTLPSPLAAGPTTGPSPLASAPTTLPSPVVAATPPPSPEEIFAACEAAFNDMSKQSLETQEIDALAAKYKTIAKADELSDQLKQVVQIRIATLAVRADNKAKLVEAQRLEKEATARQLVLQAEQQELNEQLKKTDIHVFSAVGTLQPSSLQVGSGMLYRLTDPGTGRTVVYIRGNDAKVTGLIGQFIGVTGQPQADSQLSLRVITPKDAQVVDPAQVNGKVMADIIPPSMLAQQAAVTN